VKTEYKPWLLGSHHAPMGSCFSQRLEKGDASETQSSVQVGAQTGGVALSSVNINQASPGPIGTGFSNGYPTGPVNGPGGSGGSDNTINFSTDTDMPAAISALDQALTQNQQDNQETAALAQSAIDSASGFSSGLQKIAVICSLVAGGFMGWKYLKSGKN
jgi:hypothetical protein